MDLSDPTQVRIKTKDSAPDLNNPNPGGRLRRLTSRNTIPRLLRSRRLRRRSRPLRRNNARANIILFSEKLLHICLPSSSNYPFLDHQPPKEPPKTSHLHKFHSGICRSTWLRSIYTHQNRITSTSWHSQTRSFTLRVYCRYQNPLFIPRNDSHSSTIKGTRTQTWDLQATWRNRWSRERDDSETSRWSNC